MRGHKVFLWSPFSFVVSRMRRSRNKMFLKWREQKLNAMSEIKDQFLQIRHGCGIIIYHNAQLTCFYVKHMGWVQIIWVPSFQKWILVCLSGVLVFLLGLAFLNAVFFKYLCKIIRSLIYLIWIFKYVFMCSWILVYESVLFKI